MAFFNKTSWWKQGLVLSFSLNILFLFLFYFVIFRRGIIYSGLCFNTVTICDQEREHSYEYTKYLKELKFDELLSLLPSSEMLDGHRIKDLSLGLLFSEHFLDIGSALNGPVTFLRSESEGDHFYIPQNLSDEDFIKIAKFCREERYPYTTRGLFRLLSESLKSGIVEERLFFRFLNSKEFIFFRSLMSSGSSEISPGTLMRIAVDGGSELFFETCSYDNLRKGLSEDTGRRARFSYLEKDLVLAVDLFLDADWFFITNEASDETVLKILRLLNGLHPKTDIFLDRIMASCRGNQVKNMARCLQSFYSR